MRCPELGPQQRSTLSETNNPNPASPTTENKTNDTSPAPSGVVESSGKSSWPNKMPCDAHAQINQAQHEQPAQRTAISKVSKAVPDGPFAIQTRGIRLILHNCTDTTTPLAMPCCPASACAICRPWTQAPPPERRRPAGPGEEEGRAEAAAAAIMTLS